MTAPLTMGQATHAAHLMPQLSEQDFDGLAHLVTERLGIRMPRVKLLMVQSRLLRRLRELGLDNFSDYQDLLLHSHTAELEQRHFFDLITTHKTDFYREPAHFDFFSQRILEKFPKGHFRLWSAGCSSGEEAYTLGMLLADHSVCHPGFSFEILGTDISQRILTAARDAIYPEEHIAPVPPTQRKRYLLRGKNDHTGMVRIAPELRQRVSFRQLNLMDPRFPIPAEMNVIFFRNVMIYFDRPTQARVLSSICRHLCTGGHLFISHTESIINSTLPLVQVAPSIFRKLA